MADFENLVVSGRLYVPVLLIDADGRPTEVRTPGPRPGDHFIHQLYVCSDCAVMTVDPAVHNVAHDGPACRVCGCTDDRACITPEGPCRWVEADLCSNPDCVDAAAMVDRATAPVADLVAALRGSVEAAKARRKEAGR